MSREDVFHRILASLHEAALDDARWPATTALIDEACGIGKSGTAVVVGDEAEVQFARAYAHGQPRQDLVDDYFRNYYPHDERVPRMRGLPDSRLVHIPNLYTEQERKTSVVYNEGLRRTGSQNGLNVRLDGPHGSHILWAISNSLSTNGWGSSQIQMIERLVPHVRQFVCVRQALADADALGDSLTQLLDNTQVGVIDLDRRGRVVEANDRARFLLRHGNGLHDRDGFLCAWLPADNSRLEQLLARALPAFSNEAATGGSMTVRRPSGLPSLVVHVNPVTVPRADFGRRRTAALVLVVDPGERPRIDPRLVAETLGLTPAESTVAVLLSQGKTVRDIAAETGRREESVYRHLRQIYRKQGISRQTDLVRLVLSLSAVSSGH